MSRIEFPKKSRKDGELWITNDGSQVFIGRDYALQNEIDENKAKTKERSCFKECQFCSHCVASRRGCGNPRSYDAHAGKTIDCRSCEKFGFHDCNNGFLRTSRGDAEPFTEEAQKLIDSTGGKPLME